MNGKKRSMGCDSIRTSSETTASREKSDQDSSLKETNYGCISTNYVIGRKTSKDKNDIEQNKALLLATTTEDEIVPNDTESKKDFDLNQATGVILLEHILKEVLEEKKKLQDEIRCQLPSLNCLNKVELRFGIVNEDSGASGSPLPYNEAIVPPCENRDENTIEVISTTFDDSVEVELELVKLHLHNCKPIPLWKMGKGMLLVSNQIAESFYPNCLFAPEVTVLDKTGEVNFILHIFGAPKTFQDDTEVCLVGEVKFLSIPDQIAVKNNTHEENEFLFANYFLSRNGLNSPNAVFIPKLLKLERNPIQEIRLLANFVHTTNPKFIPNWHHNSHDFCHDIIKAIGKKSDMTLLQETAQLKYKKEIVSSIREMIDSVRISHDRGSIALLLSAGQLVTDYRYDHLSSEFYRRNRRLESAWVLFLSENFLYSNIYSLKISVSGVEMGAAGLSIEFSPGNNEEGTVYYCFNRDVLVKSIQCSAEPTYNVTEIVFWLDSIENTLNALGIDCVMQETE